MKPGDYAPVHALWVSCGLDLGASDSEPEITKFLEKNPDTSLVMVESGCIIGAILGGYDGRRGLIHHLAVHPDHQGQGLGKGLVEALEKRFRAAGADAEVRVELGGFISAPGPLEELVLPLGAGTLSGVHISSLHAASSLRRALTALK